MALSLVWFLQRPAPMMLAGFALGLLTGFVSSYSSTLALAALAVLMVASLSELELRGLRKAARPALLAFPANFVCLSGFLLLAGALFPEEFQVGWVLMAAVPSAISVVPFTSVLGGDTQLSLAATVMLYLAALALTPLLTLWLVAEPVGVAPLVQALVLLVVLPLVVSRGVRRLQPSREGLHIVRNLAFFALSFIIVGANQDTIVGEPLVALGIFGACAVAIVLSAGVWAGLTRAFALSAAQRTSLLLFSSYKNQGLAAALALALFSAQGALPPIMMAAFEIVWISALLRVFAVPPGEASEPQGR